MGAGSAAGCGCAGPWPPGGVPTLLLAAVPIGVLTPTSTSVSAATGVLAPAALPVLGSVGGPVAGGTILIVQGAGFEAPDMMCTLETVALSPLWSSSDRMKCVTPNFLVPALNMVRAGEAGGVLDVVLARLAGFMEKALKTKKKVKAAMVYPIVVVGVAVSIVALLMVVVVPKFETIFEDMLDNAALPGPTELVVGVSNAGRKVDAAAGQARRAPLHPRRGRGRGRGRGREGVARRLGLGTLSQMMSCPQKTKASDICLSYCALIEVRAC